jgi:hypothetical protein
MPSKELKSLNGVEIFSIGKWNGDEYTHEDLNEMVIAFEENKQGARPYLKLGHDSKQKLLQSDGMPAAGWVNKIYVHGNKLLADFVDIPGKIYALIESRAYRKVSSEIFWNITVGNKKYKRMLAAVALIGADTPGVMNLNDILAMYKSLENNYEKLGTGDVFDLKFYKETIMPKTENEIKLELELAQQKEKAEKLQAEKKDFTAKQELAEKELADLKEFKKQAEIKEAQLVAEKELAENEKFYTELLSEKIATPAMKEHIMELLGPDKKEYTANKLSKKDTIKEILKLSETSKSVNFANNSQTGDKGNDKDAEMEKQVQQYMKDNKCNYSQAAKACMKMAKK